MKKKLLVLLLATGLVLTSFVPTKAAELVNSTGSDATDLKKGADTTQGKVTEYYPDTTVNTSTYDANSAVAVFVTKGSMIKISAPKTLILGVGESDPATRLSTATGSYKIGLLGDLGGAQKITVSFPTTVTLTSGTKSIDAAISAVKKDWTWKDVNPTTFTYATSTISVAGLSSGSYTGAFNVHLAVTNP